MKSKSLGTEMGQKKKGVGKHPKSTWIPNSGEYKNRYLLSPEQPPGCAIPILLVPFFLCKHIRKKQLPRSPQVSR